MTDTMLDKPRRRFFSRAMALMLGTSSLVACQDDNGVGHSSVHSDSTDIEKQRLDAVVDSIVPKDQDPGAVEAGVPEKLLELFNENNDLMQHGIVMLERIEVVAQHKFRRPFHRLSLAKREEIIRKTLHSRREDDQPAREAISILRGYIIEAFYISPVGQAVLDYDPPYPNGYPDYNAPPAI